MRYVNKSWYEYAIAEVKKITKDQSGFTLYDIGAGNSVLEKRVTEMGGTWIGFDYKPRRPEIIELNLESDLDHSTLPEKKPDVMIFLEVLEHLLNPGKAIQNLAEIAPKGTHLVLSTPNPFWSVVRIKFLFQNRFPMFEEIDMTGNHHVFTAWPHVVRKLLLDNGFKILEEVTVDEKASFSKIPISLSFPFTFIFRLIRKCLEAFSPISKGMSYGVIAVKV